MIKNLKPFCLVKKDALAVILRNLKIPLSSGDTQGMEFVLYESCVSELKKALSQDLSSMRLISRYEYAIGEQECLEKSAKEINIYKATIEIYKDICRSVGIAIPPDAAFETEEK
jgi:hypothetical protein